MNAGQLRHHLRSTTLRALGSDMTFTRLTAAGTSILAALMLFAPGEILTRPANRVLQLIFAHDLVLGAFFLVDGAALLWRIYDPIDRPRLEVAINVVGFVLIATFMFSVIAGIGLFSLSAAFILPMGFKRFWLIVRSGNGPSMVGS